MSRNCVGLVQKYNKYMSSAIVPKLIRIWKLALHCLSQQYQTCSYYETMELSDISDFEDLMATSSDEDIPTLEDSVH